MHTGQLKNTPAMRGRRWGHGLGHICPELWFSLRAVCAAPSSPAADRVRSAAHRKSSRTQRVERLSLLRRAHDHHRDLRTRLPAAAVAYPTDRARQFMTITPLSPSPSPIPPDAAISPAPATLRRQRPSAPPSAAKTWNIECQIPAPIASTAAKTSAPLVTQPSSCPEPTNQIKQRRQIPHRSTPASVRTPPAVSSLEVFRTPASVKPPGR